MHSRIFQISDNTEAVEPENQPDVMDILVNNDFIERIADGVDASDRDEGVEMLLESLNSHGARSDFNYDEKTASFTPTNHFKDSYFQERFESFKKQAEALTLSDFAHSNSPSLDRLADTIEDAIDFYVYANGYLIPFDRFVRGLEENKTYYIGAVFNYHA